MPPRGIVSTCERKWRVLGCRWGRGVWRPGAYVHRENSPRGLASRSAEHGGTSSARPVGATVDCSVRSAFGGGGLKLGVKKLTLRDERSPLLVRSITYLSNR